MALQVLAPGQGAQAQLGQFQMQVPQFQNFGEAKLVDPIGKGINEAVKAFGAYVAAKAKQRDEEDVAAAVTDLQKQALQFQSDWKGSHFGVEARDAGKIFSQNVDETALRMADERFKGRPELAAAFRSRAAQISFSGFSSGTAYDDQQDLQYRKDQLSGQLEGLQAIVASGSPEDIQLARDTYRRSLDTFFPGMDHTADNLKADKIVYLGAFQRNLTDGNVDGAGAALQGGLKAGCLDAGDVDRGVKAMQSQVLENVRLLGENGDIQGMTAYAKKYLDQNGETGRGGTGGNTGGARPYADLKLNEANNNPGNIRGSNGVGKGYAAYPTTLEGFKALDSLIQRRYKNMSPLKFFETYAPESDGNNPKQYALDVAKRLGLVGKNEQFNGDKKHDADLVAKLNSGTIDVSDPKVRNALMRGIAVAEGPTRRFNLDEIDYVTGTKPMPAGYQSRDLRTQSKDAGSVSGSPYGTQQDQFQAKLRSTMQAAIKKQETLLGQGTQEANELAKFGDTSQLKVIAANYRAAGFTEKADQYEALAKTYDDTRDARTWAKEAPLSMVRAHMVALEEALKPGESDSGERKTLQEYENASAQLKAVSEVYSVRAKAYKDDPAAAADADGLDLSENATMADRVEARLVKQRENGVISPVALTKAEVESIGAMFEQTTAPATFIAEIRKQYGTQYDAAMKQLVQAKKVPRSVNLMSDMTPAAGSVLAKTSRGKWVEETEKSRGMDTNAKGALRADVTTEMNDVLETVRMQGDSQTVNALVSGAYGMALWYINNGMDQDDAVERATKEIITDRYHVMGSYRVPVRFDSEKVSRGSGVALSGVAGDVDNLLIAVPQNSGLSTEQIRRRKADLIKDQGRWITNADESGLVLCVGEDATPVRKNDGTLVTIPFDLLEKLGTEDD